MDRKKIAIIGLGGVGGYFGFKVSSRNHYDNEVTFVARGETYDILRAKGLTLLSSEENIPTTKPNKVVENIFDIADADLILICVKEYDLENLCIQLKGYIRQRTILLPLMNGVDIYDRIRKIISNGIVLPACVYVASHIKAKGIIEHKGNTGKIILGKDPAHIGYEPKWVVELLTHSGIDTVFTENSQSAIWTKFSFIASFGIVSARYNKTIGQVIEDATLKDITASIMREIKLLADKLVVHLDNSIIEQVFQKASTFPYETPTSLQLDIQAKKEHNELELFAGAIINYGRTFGIPVVETERLYNEIVSSLHQFKINLNAPNAL